MTVSPGWVLRRIAREGGLTAYGNIVSMLGAGVFAATTAARSLFADGFLLENLRGAEVRNVTGGSLAAYSLVVVNGWNEANLRNTIAKADADDATNRVPMYILRTALADLTNGLAFKTCRTTASLNTIAGVVGAAVYADATTAAGWTLTKPTGADARPIVVGRVAVSHATLGVIEFNLSAEQPAGVGTSDLQDLAVSTAKIAAAAVTSAKIDPTVVQIAIGTLTSAQVKALRATPIAMVAAPGVGFMHEFVSGQLILDYGSNVFTEAGYNLDVRLGTVQVSQTVETTGWIDTAGDALTNIVPKLDAIANKASSENKALNINNSGAAEIAGNAAADSVVRYRIAYRTHPTGW